MPTYRYENGQIEIQWDDGQWTRSAHDGAGPKEVAEYERGGLAASLVAALREKYAERGR